MVKDIADEKCMRKIQMTEPSYSPQQAIVIRSEKKRRNETIVIQHNNDNDGNDVDGNGNGEDTINSQR